MALNLCELEGTNACKLMPVVSAGKYMQHHIRPRTSFSPRVSQDSLAAHLLSIVHLQCNRTFYLQEVQWLGAHVDESWS